MSVACSRDLADHLILLHSGMSEGQNPGLKSCYPGWQRGHAPKGGLICLCDQTPDHWCLMVFETACGIQDFQMHLTRDLWDGLSFSTPVEGADGVPESAKISLDVNMQTSVFRQWTPPTSGDFHVGVVVFARCPCSDLLMPRLWQGAGQHRREAKRVFQVTFEET